MSTANAQSSVSELHKPKTNFLSSTAKSVFMTPLLLFIYIIYALLLDIPIVRLDLPFLFLLTIACYVLSSSFFYLINSNRLSIPILFSFVWSGLLYIASLKLSKLQVEWHLFIISYIYIVPIICSKAFCFFRYPASFNKKCYYRHAYHMQFCFLFFLLSASGLGIMVYQLGYLPGFSADPNIARMDFNLPIVNVAAWCFTSVLGLLAGFALIVHKKKICLLFILYCILFYLSIASRSGVIGLLLYLVLLYSITRNMAGPIQLFTNKNMFFMFIIFLLFVFLGQMRMRQGDFNISKYGSFRENNVSLNWLYGYAFVNLDNLQLAILKDEPQYAGLHTFQAINPFLGKHTDNQALNKYHYIGKFNLGTGFRPYYLDWGMVGAPICLFLFWFAYSLLSRLFRSDILYCYTAYISSQAILFVLDDRFTSFMMVFSIAILVFYDLFLIKRIK